MSVTLYSKAELKLIEAVSEKWFKTVTSCSVNPADLYKQLAIEAFCDGKSTPAIEALRKAVKATRIDNFPYRLTPEFDKLCEFE